MIVATCHFVEGDWPKHDADKKNNNKITALFIHPRQQPDKAFTSALMRTAMSFRVRENHHLEQ
jgi:hypothetical protein